MCSSTDWKLRSFARTWIYFLLLPLSLPLPPPAFLPLPLSLDADPDLPDWPLPFLSSEDLLVMVCVPWSARIGRVPTLCARAWQQS